MGDLTRSKIAISLISPDKFGMWLKLWDWAPKIDGSICYRTFEHLQFAVNKSSENVSNQA
jgi:hypothetical protein